MADSWFSPSFWRNQPIFAQGQNSSDVEVDPLTGIPVKPIPVVDKVLRGLAQGAVDAVKTPGAAMQPNPYPTGSEEAAWYDQNRQDTMNQWAPGMALGMIGGGTSFAEAGALGVGGGRPTFASNAAARAEINEATALIDKYYKPKMTPEERQQVLDAISRKSQAQQYIMQTQGNIVQGHVPSDNPVVEAAHRSLSSASDWMRNQRQSAPPWSWRNQ